MPFWVAVGNILNGIGHAIAVAAKAIAVAARWLAVKAWAGLKFIGGKVASFGRAVGNAFSKLWDTVIKPAVRALARFAQKLHSFVSRYARHVLAFLKKIATWIDRIYTRFISPVLTWLRRVRTVLELLGRLGVRWAAELADKLLQLEMKIWNAFQLVTGYLNGLIGWVNWILDPRGYLNGGLLLSSLDRYIGGVVALILNAGLVGPRKQNPQVERSMPDVFNDFAQGRMTRSQAADNSVLQLRKIVYTRGGFGPLG